MNDNMITWNIRNWLTVFLMFITAWAILGLGIRLAKGGASSVGGMLGAGAADAHEKNIGTASLSTGAYVNG